MTAGSISVEGGRLLHLPRQGREDRQARAAAASLRGDSASGSTWSARTSRRWSQTSRSGPTRATAAASPAGPSTRNLRRYLTEGWAAAGGVHIFRHSRREAAARRRRVDRGGVALPRPQQPGGDDDVPAAAGGAGGPELGEGGGGDWPLDESSVKNSRQAMLTAILIQPFQRCDVICFGFDGDSGRLRSWPQILPDRRAKLRRRMASLELLWKTDGHPTAEGTTHQRPRVLPLGHYQKSARVCLWSFLAASIHVLADSSAHSAFTFKVIIHVRTYACILHP